VDVEQMTVHNALTVKYRLLHINFINKLENRSLALEDFSWHFQTYFGIWKNYRRNIAYWNEISSTNSNIVIRRFQ